MKCPNCGERLADVGISESLRRNDNVHPSMKTPEEASFIVDCGNRDCDARLSLWTTIEQVRKL